MKTINMLIHNEEETIKLGSLIASISYPNYVIAMNGDLGCGKTTMTKGIGKTLGIKRVINSPTFTIMKTYDINNNVNNINKLYHLDVYRIVDPDADFSLAEYFELGGLCVVEWADIIKDLLPDTYILINMKTTSNNERLVSITYTDEFIDNLLNLVKGEQYEIIC